MSDINDYTPAARAFTGRQMLLIMLVFFGVIIAVNVTMVRFAVSSFGGLVVENSYVASQHFQTDRAAALAQPIADWDVEVLSAGGDQLRILVRHEGSWTYGGKLTALALRPTHRRDGKSLVLHKFGQEFIAEQPLEAGLWDLALTTEDGQYRTVRIRVPEAQP